MKWKFWKKYRCSDCRECIITMKITPCLANSTDENKIPGTCLAFKKGSYNKYYIQFEKKQKYVVYE